MKSIWWAEMVMGSCGVELIFMGIFELIELGFVGFTCMVVLRLTWSA